MDSYLTIQYHQNFVDQNIDIDLLRPNKSYDFLLANRNGDLADVLKDKQALKQFLRERPCPTCESDESFEVLEKDNLKIVQCKNCETAYVNPIFDEARYRALYQSTTYQKVVKQLGEDSHLYRTQRFGQERASFITKFHNPNLPKTVLEIGCSTGFTLEALGKLGWEAQGVELNPSAAAFGRERGLQIHQLAIEEFHTEQCFSAICLFDVLEHLVNPSQMLKRANSLLVEGGNIFIYVPNWASASKELIGPENCHYIWPTHHLTYFTPQTLKLFLESHGFDVFHWETEGLDLHDISWQLNNQGNNESGSFFEENINKLQFYINKSGHGKNLRMYATKNGCKVDE